MSASHITLFNAIEDELFTLARESTDDNWQAFTNAKGRYVMRIPYSYYLVPKVGSSIELISTEIDSKELDAIIASEGLNTGYAYVIEKALPTLLAQIPAALKEAEKYERSLTGNKILFTILRYLQDRLVPRWKYLPQALRNLYIYLLFVTVSDVEPSALIYDEEWYDEPPDEYVKEHKLELEKFDIVREQIIDILAGLDTVGIITLVAEEDAPKVGVSRDLDSLIMGYLPGGSYYTVMDREGILNLLR